MRKCDCQLAFANSISSEASRGKTSSYERRPNDNADNYPCRGPRLAEKAFKKLVGEGTFAKKIPFQKVIDTFAAVLPDRRVEEVGTKPGDKPYQQMMGPEDDCLALSFDYLRRILLAATFGMDKFEGP